MSISFFSNARSISARDRIESSQKEAGKQLQKLASGKRINSAQDDAAGLAIAANLVAQLSSSNQSVRNGTDALDIAGTADAALGQSAEILGQLRELAIRSASGGLNDAQRGDIQVQAAGLRSELDRVAHATEYNGKALLNASGQLAFQVGTTGDPNSQINIATTNATAGALGLASLSLASQGGAQSALGSIDEALRGVSSARSALGAQSNRAASAINTALSRSQALAESHSRIADADYAAATSNLTRNNILGSAGISVLAQANQSAQMVMRLLR